MLRQMRASSLVIPYIAKPFRIYNKRTMTIEESIHVYFADTNITSLRKEFLDDIVDSLEDMQIKKGI